MSPSENPKASFARWVEQASASTVPMTVARVGAIGHFEPEIRAHQIGELQVFSTWQRQDFGYVVRHERALGARGHQESLLFSMVGRGALREFQYNDGDTGDLGVGDWVLLHPDDAIAGGCPAGQNATFSVSVPLSVASGYGLDIGDRFGRRMSARELPNQLVAGYVSAIASSQSIESAALGASLAHQFLSLLSLALHRGRGPREVPPEEAQPGLTVALQRYLDDHFADHTLSAARLAAQFGVSSRYVHRLFEGTSMTFSEHLYDRRLRHAHALLTAKPPTHHTVLDVALECGFVNPTHFARRYRERYGVAPREAMLLAKGSRFTGPTPR